MHSLEFYQSHPDTKKIKQNVVGIYDRAAKTYDHAGPRFFTHFGERLVEMIDIHPGMQILDVATGRGAILFAAEEKAGPGKVTGFDLSAKMVKHTKEETEA